MANYAIDALTYSWQRWRLGELPIPPLLMLGLFTRLFVMTHLTTRLATLLSMLRQEELRSRLERPGASPTADGPLRPTVAHLALLHSIMTKQPGSRGAAVVASRAGYVATAASAFGLTTLVREQLAPILKDSDNWHALVAGLIFTAIVVVQGALLTGFVVISSYMRMLRSSSPSIL